MERTVAYERRTPLGFAEVLSRLGSELQARGFGTLADLRVHQILKEKIGVERPPMAILEVCSPRYADRALTIEPESALFLPCKIVVRAEGAGARVELLRPRPLMAVFQAPPDLLRVAEEVEPLLVAAVDAATGAPARKD